LRNGTDIARLHKGCGFKGQLEVIDSISNKEFIIKAKLEAGKKLTKDELAFWTKTATSHHDKKEPSSSKNTGGKSES
jgi:hypothetical protein